MTSLDKGFFIEAVELSLEVWRFIEAHPEIKDKKDLPIKIYAKIRHMELNCPLCQMRIKDIIYCGWSKSNKEKADKNRCPLNLFDKYDNCPLYVIWILAETENERQAAAHTIVQKLEECIRGLDYG